MFLEIRPNKLSLRVSSHFGLGTHERYRKRESESLCLAMVIGLKVIGLTSI